MMRLLISKLFFVFSLLTLFIAVTAQNAQNTTGQKAASEAAPATKDLAPIATPAAPNSNNKNEAPALKKNSKDSAANILTKPKIDSIMFSDVELKDIERALDSYDNNKLFVATGTGSDEKKEFKPEENVKSYIYLNSILYFSPESWSVWINDKKVSSNNNKHGSEFYIKSISGNEVSILWTISMSKWKILAGKKTEETAPSVNKDNQVEVIFTLKPNQTFTLTNGKVVEGRIL